MEEKKLTDKEIIKALEYSNAVLVKQFDDLKERYVKMLNLNEKVIAELQKQVDELKKQFLSACENCHLKKDIELLSYQKQQAVKDTAKEIFKWLKSKVIMTEIPHGSEPCEEDVEAVMWWQIEEHFKKKYSVEVE